MAIIPNLIEQFVLLTLNQGPGPMLDIMGALGFRMVLAAVRLGVFEGLSDGPLTIDELARQLGTDAHATGMLLETLIELGYVRKRGERYANTAMTSKWLLSSSVTNLAPYYSFWGTVLPQLLNQLEESIQSGEASINLYDWFKEHPETSDDFQEAMIAMAHIAASEIVKKLKLPPTAQRLLDVGGGHGTYSIALCERHPQLSATIFDSSEALKVGRDHITAAKMSERITVQEGNFFSDELGRGYDVVLLFNIVHGLSPAQNIELFGKVARALTPSGLLVIVEQLVDGVPSPMARGMSRILGLNYFHLLGGQIYTFDELANCLTSAGFTTPSRIHLWKSGSSLLLASVAG